MAGREQSTPPPIPALVTLLATMRSCLCGGLPQQSCTCTPRRLARYRRRAAEPLGPLFDLQCEMGIVRSSAIETAAAVRARILGARAVARERFGDGGPRGNAAMTAADLRRFCPLD